MTKLIAAILLLGTFSTLSAAELWTTTDGITVISFDAAQLAAHGLEVLSSTRPTDAGPVSGGLSFEINPQQTALVTTTGSHIDGISGTLKHLGTLAISARAKTLQLLDFVVVSRETDGGRVLLFADGSASNPEAEALLEVSAKALTLSTSSRALQLPSADISLTPYGAAVLGLKDGGGLALGKVTIQLTVLQGKVSRPASAPRPVMPAVTGATPGADLTFCSLDSLEQVGRKADVASFSAGTTSWNVGTEKLGWWAPPGDWRHPYIVLNLYRLKDGRFEQLGGSWAKHGFYAASFTQCGPCDTSVHGTQLPVGCTDTYSAFINSEQIRLGPRYEIDPWEGFWQRTLSSGWQSHLLQPSHTHDQVEHLLKVHDRDLDPSLNGGTSYVLEGYYVHYQDTNVMNSAAWKPVAYRSGQPGGVWNLDMTDATVAPTIGFAIDAWKPDRKTVLAQQIPPVKNVSVDGRCILAVKTTALAGNMWRYDYALLNIDMARQVGTITVDVPASATVTDLRFSSPDLKEEAFNAPDGTSTDDAPWQIQRSSTAVVLQTSTNPLRWGYTYSFSFTADRPPSDTMVTLGLFKPGQPATVSGTTAGPR